MSAEAAQFADYARRGRTASLSGDESLCVTALGVPVGLRPRLVLGLCHKAGNTSRTPFVARHKSALIPQCVRYERELTDMSCAFRLLIHAPSPSSSPAIVSPTRSAAARTSRSCK